MSPTVRMPALPGRSMLAALALLAACGGDRSSSVVTSREQSDSARVRPDTALTAAVEDSLSSPTVTQLGRLLSQRWAFDLDSMISKRVIRVLVVPSRMLYFEDEGRLRGASYEAVTEFERVLNRKFRTGSRPIECVFIPVPRDQLISRLAEGRGEIAVGLLTVTPERRRLVDFSDPIFSGVREIVVSGPGAAPLHTVEGLSGRDVYVRASSSQAETLRRFNEQLRSRGIAPVGIRPADENLEAGDILELVNTGVVPYTVVDDRDADFYGPLLPHVTVHDSLVLASGGSLAWAVRKNTPKLQTEVNAFVRDHRVGTTFGNVIVRRYFKDNPWIKNPAEAEARRRFETVVGAFHKYGDEFGLDPLLLLAQGFQESGLDQGRRSHAGAVGVMQIKPSTAASPPIGISGVEQLDNNVRAGAKYLRWVIDRYYRDQPMTPLDQEIFAIASYNAGPARIAGLRRQAASLGLDPNRWFQHVELVASEEIGRETVDYVRNIYKYYLTYNLLEQRASARETAESAAVRRQAR